MKLARVQTCQELGSVVCVRVLMCVRRCGMHRAARHTFASARTFNCGRAEKCEPLAAASTRCVQLQSIGLLVVV